ncbi:MAG: PIG-L family deacetylase [Candidatus Flexifilum sp.]|jgi:LmbE family N-acetylglucosaminyl deacetylase/uncharacterized membrane protein HdeD (DUF308 family)
MSQVHSETPSSTGLLKRLLHLRAGMMIGVGGALLIAPLWTASEIVLLLGIVILADATLMVVHLRSTTHHLWKISLAKAAAEFGFGSLLVIRQIVGLDLLLAAVGLLLIFRAALEFISFSESYARVNHQRVMFASAVITLVAGLAALFTLPRHASYLVMLIGLIIFLEGLLRLASSIYTRHHAPRERREASLTFLHIDPLKYKKALILTPHPDDLEGFVGGLAARMQAEITSVIFAGGDRGVWERRYQEMPKDTYIHLRLEEAEQAARLLGVREIIYMGYLDRGVVCDDATIERTVALLRQYQPDVVISFEFYRSLTPYPHPDHLATGQVVRHAVARYEQRDSLDYFVTSTLLPNRFIDVSGVRQIKLTALACHTTQAGLNAIIFPFFENFITRIWGIFVGSDHSEGYRQIDIPALVRKLASERPS